MQEIQLEWDLEEQKVHLEKENLAAELATGSPNLVSSDISHMKERVRQIRQGQTNEEVDLPRQGLQQFLTDKIRQVQQRTEPERMMQELPQLEQAKAEVSENAKETSPGKHRFKASTLTHVAAMKMQGDARDRLENMYIERVCKEQSDYFFERYIHEKGKKRAQEMIPKTQVPPTPLPER